MTHDPIQTARLAAILRENAPVHAATGDAAFAATCAEFAAALELLLAFAALPPPAAAPASVARKPRLSRHRQAQMAITWFFNRREAFLDKQPPSEAQDIKDACDLVTGIPGVSRDVIRKHRPVEWKLSRGKRPQSPNS